LPPLMLLFLSNYCSHFVLWFARVVWCWCSCVVHTAYVCFGCTALKLRRIKYHVSLSLYTLHQK